MDNPFSRPAAAQLYAEGRPYFHPLVIRQITQMLPTGGARFPRALDVGCGTGLSSRALLDLADQVVGLDESESMLRLARYPSRIFPVCASAERLPFCDGAFPLITVCSAFHWFARSKFLDEVARVLAPQGFLIVYWNRFRPEKLGNTTLRKFLLDHFYAHFPLTPVGHSLEPAVLAEAHPQLCLLQVQNYANSAEFTLTRALSYFLSDYNVLESSQAQSPTGFDAIRRWLGEHLQKATFGCHERFDFTGKIILWRRV